MSGRTPGPRGVTAPALVAAAMVALLLLGCEAGTAPGWTPAAGSPTAATGSPALPTAPADSPAPPTASPASPDATPGVVPSPDAPPGSPVIGLIIAIERTGLTEVQGFTFRTDAGEEIPFLLGRLENEAEFPPSHLAEHMAAGDVLEVHFRLEGAGLVAYRIEHAGDDEH
jgi:hypothetical protein